MTTVSPIEAWAIRRRLSGMAIPDDLHISSLVRALTTNGTSTQQLKHIVSADPELLKAVTYADPSGEPPGEDDALIPTEGRTPDDDDLALLFVKHLEGKFAVFYLKWHRYANGYWQPTASEKVGLEARAFLRGYRHRSVKVGANKVAAVVKLAGQDCFIDDTTINAHSDARARYVNLRNGLYNLETHTLEPHRADLYFINQLPFAFDPAAKCPTFVQFLRTSLVDHSGKHDQQMALLMTEALGYSLTARTDLQASFWLIGAPASGKSTLVSLIRAIMGSLHTTIDLNQMGSNKFMLSGIVGKRAVTFTESSAGTVLPDSLYKTVVGGSDEVFADVKNKDAIAFRPEAKIWWAMNESPRTTDRSGAMLRRLYPILFPLTISQDKRIADLDRRLASEVPGIFNVLMMAYKRLQERGTLIMPEAARVWLEDYKQRNDTESSFLRDMCLRVEGERLRSSELYAAYKMWCESNGFKPKNLNQAAEDWRRLGLISIRQNDANYWQGVKFK